MFVNSFAGALFQSFFSLLCRFSPVPKSCRMMYQTV
jgi:hypothetical protein